MTSKFFCHVCHDVDNKCNVVLKRRKVSNESISNEPRQYLPRSSSYVSKRENERERWLRLSRQSDECEHLNQRVSLNIRIDRVTQLKHVFARFDVNLSGNTRESLSFTLQRFLYFPIVLRSTFINPFRSTRKR